jgi:iron complex outermembrane recepter protein
MKTSIQWGISALALVVALPVIAVAQDSDTNDDITTAEKIVVIGQIPYRNRTEATEPTLEYDQEYFQRFEPLTAGDALKRVPSVTFLSDVIESDGARLRGLEPGYTQILINGEKVPGSQFDRSFFMDRIPAELIDRVEIVRSSSARRSGDAVAGTLNIVLRDGFNLEGGYARAGALRFDDGEVKPSLGAVWGGEVAGGRVILGANLQGRYNPKLKSSLRFGDSPENDPSFFTNEFDNREDQTDTRDGTDYQLNGSYVFESGDHAFEVSGFYVKTDRTQDERSFEYDDLTAMTGPVTAGNLLTDNAQFVEIDQENYSLRTRYARDWSLGETKLKLGFASFEESQFDTENEIDFDRSTPRFTGDLTLVDFVDEELSAEIAHELEFSGDRELEVGLFWQQKDRSTSIQDDRNRFNLTNADRAYDQFSDTPNRFATAHDPVAPLDGGLNTVEETRLDAFAAYQFEGKAYVAEIGVRYETTDFSINDLTVGGAAGNRSNDYAFLLPSAHIRFDLSDDARLSVSAARTVRRPRFDFISPALLEAELGDNDLLGNPELEPESAWGFDVGYEKRLGRQGIVGVNVFYRAVEDLIEVANTGAEGSEGAGTFILTPRNSGDGEVYGIEFDLSTPLSAFGLDNTGVFANYSVLDSSIDDVFGSRRFNGQSDYVYNFGFIQDLPAYQAAFGATYRKQGDAIDRIVGEEVRTSYGADLELFIEKSLYERFTLRLVGSNLLNASKDEVFNKFDTIDDQIARDFDEYELETEEAGPVFQLVGRYAF